jgi:hypothetical protein
MKQENIEALQWFVDYFANLDLENIKPGDKAKLLIEADEYLWPTKELEELAASFELTQVLSSGAMDRFMGWAQIDKESPQYWTAIVESQRSVRGVFLDTVLTAAPLSLGIGLGGSFMSADTVPDAPTASAEPSEMPTVSWNVASGHHVPAPQMLWGKDTMLWWVGKGGNELKKPYTLKFLPIADSQKNYLFLKILRLLDGFPAHAIRRCPGCERFFFNPTKREKTFCGNRCMWRVNTAKRREADKEGYNEYQRKLMQDRYREKKGHPRKKTKKREG